MAYVSLGQRSTYWLGSGGSSPEGLDLRAWGKTYYDQTEEDKANNRSRIKIEYGTQVNEGGFNTSYTITARVQQKVNGSWTTVDSKTYSFSGNITATGSSKKGEIADVFVYHNDDGTGQTRTYVTINDTGAFLRSESFMYIYDLPTIEATSPVINNVTIGALARTAAITDLDISWGRGCSLASISWDYGIDSPREYNSAYTSLGGLTPNTDYQCVISVVDTKGNPSEDYYCDFTTLPNGNIPYKKISGTWTMGPYNYVKSSGAWTKANTTYYKSSGSWKTGP